MQPKVWLEKESDCRQLFDGLHPQHRKDRRFVSFSVPLFIQLDYPPYAWTPTAVSAFQKYIEEGKGGWIGFIMRRCWGI